MEEKWHKNDKEIVGQANKKSDERRNQENYPKSWDYATAM